MPMIDRRSLLAMALSLASSTALAQAAGLNAQ
jgi:hypothetical protein